MKLLGFHGSRILLYCENNPEVVQRLNNTPGYFHFTVSHIMNT